MQSINQQLQNLYTGNWQNLSAELLEQVANPNFEKKPTHPLLLNLDEEKYGEADKVIMIFGQETNDWEYLFSGDMQTSLDIYADFYNSGRCFTYGGQFWNGFAKFKNLVQAKFPGEKIYFIWNNIIKIGVAGLRNAPPDYIYQAERKNLDVIRQEIELIQPHSVIFFTGPDYDRRILDVFTDAEFQQISEKFTPRQLTKVETGLPKHRPPHFGGVADYYKNFKLKNMANYLWTITAKKQFGKVAQGMWVEVIVKNYSGEPISNEIVKAFNEKYGAGTITGSLQKSYFEYKKG